MTDWQTLQDQVRGLETSLGNVEDPDESDSGFDGAKRDVTEAVERLEKLVTERLDEQEPELLS